MKALFTSKLSKILLLILCLMLTMSLTACSGDEEPVEETNPAPTEMIVTEPPTEAPTEPPTVPATMGTVITGKLNIRKDAGSKYEAVGSYLEGERIEILETKNVDGTVWGRTHLGWVGMGYVRMDGTPVSEKEPEEGSTEPTLITDGSTGILGYGVVDYGELNVRLGPGTEYGKVREVTKCARYAYYQLQDGWARIEDGWVSTDYFYIEGTVADDGFTASVTEDDLNIRTGPNTSFKSIGTYKKGEAIEILAQVHTWGYTEKGWVFLSYVEEVAPTYTTGSGNVTIGLNIRKEPNAESEAVGTYKEGDFVTITEVSGSWGKTDKGWINLKYVRYN